MIKKIVATSGYWNPLHVGHLDLLQRARALGDFLVVIVNTDLQVALKGSKTFMTQEDRLTIIRGLSCVDMAVLAVDEDGTVCKTLSMLRPHIFAKGGDRFWGNVPENTICEQLGIKIVDGLGDKIRASSELIRNATR